MILREDKKFWLMLDLSGAVTLMRRDDFARLLLPRGVEAKALIDAVKAAHATDPTGEAVLAIYDHYLDRLQPLDPSGFLPTEIFFRGGGARFSTDEIREIRVYPRGSGDFAISMAGPASWVEATTAQTMDEAHRIGVALSTRFKAEFIDLAAMYHSPWVEQVIDGKTHKGFAYWLNDEQGGPTEAPVADFCYQGFMMWDGESDRPWWAPLGEVDPLMDVLVYPTRVQCRESDPELEGEDFAQPTRIRIARATGAIQVIGDDGEIFRELSRADYYNAFGMTMPAVLMPPASSADTPTP